MLEWALRSFRNGYAVRPEFAQEFVRTIINYVRENGDVELTDMVNTEPFNNYDLNEVFGINLPTMISVVQTLHEVVQAA